MNRKTIFIILALSFFTFFSLFFVLKKNYIELPSENWSNSIILKEFQNDYDFNKTKDNNIFSKIYNKKLYVILGEDKGLNFSVFDLNGEEIYSKKIEKDIYFDLIKGDINKDIISFISYSDTEKLIIEYDININNLEKINKKEYQIDGDKVFIEKDHYLYTKNGIINLFYKDKKYNFKLEKEIFPSEISSLIEENKFIMIGLVNNNGSKYVYKTEYNMENSEIEYFEVDKIKYLTSSKFISTDIIKENDKYFFYSEIYNPKYKTTYINLYALDKDNNILKKDISLEKYDPQIKIFNYKNQFSYLILENTYLGYTDISKKNEKFPNVIFHNFHDEISNDLTNTKYITTKPIFLEDKDYDYLLHVEKRNNKNALLLSSTDPRLIEKSKKINMDEIINLLLNTFTTLLPFFYFGLPIFIKVLIPIFLIMVPIGFIKLNWVEQNQKAFLILIVLVHFISKTYTFFEDIIFGIKLSNMTVIFNNKIFIFMLYLLISLINLYLLKLMSKENQNQHFLAKYFKFAVIDIMFFSFIFYPYYFL